MASFLTALDAHPVTVVLATNRPGILHTALDRRLAIRIRLDLPGFDERRRILDQELALAGMRVAGDPECLERLARHYRVSGGFWSAAIRVARTLAWDQAPGTIAHEHLEAACLDCRKRMGASDLPPGLAYADAPTELPSTVDAADSKRMTALVLDRLNDSKAPSRVVALRVRNPGLAHEVARQVADHLDLPLATQAEVKDCARWCFTRGGSPTAEGWSYVICGLREMEPTVVMLQRWECMDSLDMEDLTHACQLRGHVVLLKMAGPPMAEREHERAEMLARTPIVG